LSAGTFRSAADVEDDSKAALSFHIHIVPASSKVRNQLVGPSVFDVFG
jgi:hypothetical protein